jgi:hypothetical protein
MQFDQLKRRAFITLLGGAAAAWPLAARAQQPTRLPIIGFLGANTPSTQRQWTAAFERRLRELGWIEGRNVTIEYRWAESRFERSPAIIAEFVRLKVDVIVTHGTANVVAAKEATVGHSNRICSGGGSGAITSSRVWRDPAATSLACRPRYLILPASVSNSCAKSFQVYAAWSGKYAPNASVRLRLNESVHRCNEEATLAQLRR